MPKHIVPEGLIVEAQTADARLVAAWSGIKTNVRLFGEACKWIQEKELHKYIQKPGSKKGFMSFDEYIASRTGGEASRTSIFDAIDIYCLTTGPNAIPADIVDAMPRRNQLKVASLRKKHPELVTQKLVKKAVEEPVDEFAVTAQSELNAVLPSDEQRDLLTTLRYRVLQRTANLFHELMYDIKLLEVVKDGDRTLSLDDKALANIIWATRERLQDDIDNARKKLNDSAPDLSEAKETSAVRDYTAPDFPQAVGEAAAEKRLIVKGSEARN